MIAKDHGASGAVVKTLLVTDLVDSTHLLEKIGDRRALEVSERHDRVARDLLARFDGREIDKTDGFLLLFDTPRQAVGYALSYHEALFQLSTELGIQLRSRAGIHQGEVFLRENMPEDVARGAKPLEVEGIAKPTAARLMSVALGKQTLLTRAAFDEARRGAEAPTPSVTWLAHGPYLFQGLADPIEIFEVGAEGAAPLREPPDSPKVRRAVRPGDEVTLGWRPAVGLGIPRCPGWYLRRKLGFGGYGEVWLAQREGEGAAGEERVFKFCFDADRLRALQREVSLFRLLKKELGERRDIAAILDWDFTQAPYFLESEYTAGGNLIQWTEGLGGIEQVPLPVRLEWVAQVAEALATAHSVGVLHKDVKPQNILIEPVEDDRTQAVLTDFGISQVTDERLLIERDITLVGLTELETPDSDSAQGTRLYMAPESLAGKIPTVQADIYALGVLLYQVVVGDFNRALAPGWRREVTDALLAEDIAAFSDGDPDRRPGSAMEVASRLRTLEARRLQREAEARRQREAEAARQALERSQARRRVAMRIAAAAVLMLVVVSLLAWQAIQARREESQAREDAEQRRQQAEQLIEFMLGDLREKLAPIGRLAILNDVGEQALTYFATVPPEDLTDEELSFRAKALAQLGAVRFQLGELESAVAAFRESLILARGLSLRDRGNDDWLFELGQSHFWVGYLEWQRKDLEAAVEHFQAYQDVCEELVARDPARHDWRLELAYSHSNIASVLLARTEPDRAVAALEASRTLFTELLGAEPSRADLKVELAQVLSKLGSARRTQGQFEEARRMFQEQVEMLTPLVAAEDPDVVWVQDLTTAHSHLGEAMLTLGRVSEAREAYRKTLEGAAWLVQEDPDHTQYQWELSASHRKMGDLLVFVGEFGAARRQLEASQQIMETLVAGRPGYLEWQLRLALAHRSLAELEFRQGRLSAARQRNNAALEILEPLHREAPDDTRIDIALGSGLRLLGDVLARGGEGESARAAWQRAAALLEAPAAATRDPAVLLPRAEILLSQGQPGEARAALEILADLGFRGPRFLELADRAGLQLEGSGSGR